MLRELCKDHQRSPCYFTRHAVLEGPKITPGFSLAHPGDIPVETPVRVEEVIFHDSSSIFGGFAPWRHGCLGYSKILATIMRIGRALYVARVTL